MPTLATLYGPIAADLERFGRIFDDELSSDVPVVRALCDQVRGYRGKMLRPALLLLSGRACERVTDAHHTLAAVVELVHLATLVHDDVLDEADLRRRLPTINLLHGNEAAVLLGDYLISHAFHLCSALDSQYASRTIGSTTNTVCEGELQQISHRDDDTLTVNEYYQIITKKTAVLTGTCCLLGAHYADAGAATIAAFERYGMDVGVAFQITDDVLDIVGSRENMGKTLGRDLDQHKLTLPLIHCLGEADRDDRAELQALLAAPAPDHDRLNALLGATDSIDYALETARRHVDSAVACLADLPASDARDALVRLAQMILEREQ